MQCVLAAEAAILIHLESVGIVFLVLLCVIVTLLALAARESDLNSHFRHLLFIRVLPVDFGGETARTSLLRRSFFAQNPHKKRTL